MNVLSTFDGIAGGRVALERAGVDVEKYYASEIDPYAISIASHNYPNIIHIGDVEKISGFDYPDVDLLIGGSPCQSFSAVGDGSGFDGKSKLFWEYCRILYELQERKPDIKFFLENVVMKQEWMDVISTCLGVQPIIINSNVVTGQSRPRAYWTNIPYIGFPEKKEINFIDLLLPKEEINPKFFLSKKEKLYMDREVKGGRNHWDFSHHSDTENPKSACVVANFFKGVPYNVLIDRRGNQCSMWSCDFQNQTDICNGCVDGDNFQYDAIPNSTIRKMLPIECERLQTLPDNYTSVDGKISNTQRYKSIGNGWSIDVIAWFFKKLK